MKAGITNTAWANERSGVDAGRPFCLHTTRCWPGATHRDFRLELMPKVLSAILICGIFAVSASSGTDTQTSPSVEGIFLYATRSGDLERVKALLKDNPALIYSKDT